MLKEHLLFPQQSIQSNITFQHYLSAGSHQAPYRLKGISALSRVYLPKNQRLPTLPPFTALLLLEGCLRVNGDEFKVESFVPGKLIREAKNLINEHEQTADFILIVFKDSEWKQNRITVHQTHKQLELQIKRELILLLKGEIFGMGDTKLSTEDNPNAILTFEYSKLTISANSIWLSLILQ